MPEIETESVIALTSGRALARNTVWNLIGLGAPLLVALFAIPVLIKALGTARFGVLTLAWMVVGYFSLFDLGLGRALTKLVAEKLGAGKESEVPALVWTALVLMAGLGIIGIAIAAGLSSWLVHRALKIPAGLQAESLKAFYLLAVSIPIIISTAGLRGVLEAYQRFDLTNSVRIPLGIFTFLGPLAVLPFSKSLFPIVAALVAVRLLAWGAHLLLCLRVVPALHRKIKVQRAMVRPLVRFGGWMTVSNIISPLMVYFDRFLIGAMISMVAVAYYATPYEVLTRLRIISGAVVGVLFPAFSTTLRHDRTRTVWLFGRGINYIFLALFPPCLIIITLAYEGLELWLGVDFAQHSALVVQMLAVGMFVNSLAQIPFALIQGTGRPDITAKLHLVELPFYLAGVWWLTVRYGIEGTAIAWMLRVVVDMAALGVVTWWLLPDTAFVIRRSALMVIMALGILMLAILTTGLLLKTMFLIGVMIAFLPAAWFLVLTDQERVFVSNRLKIIYIFK